MLLPTWFLGHCIMKQRYWKADLKDALQWELSQKGVTITQTHHPTPNTTVTRYTKRIRIPIWYFNERSEYFEATMDKAENQLTIDRYVKNTKRSPEPYIQSYDIYYKDEKGKLNQVRHIYWIYLPVKIIELAKYTMFWITHQSRQFMKTAKG